MKVRFQVDADLNEEIVAGVMRREPAIDFQTAEDAGLRGLNDPDVLARAASENRILVTHNRITSSVKETRLTSPGLERVATLSLTARAVTLSSHISSRPRFSKSLIARATALLLFRS